VSSNGISRRAARLAAAIGGSLALAVEESENIAFSFGTGTRAASTPAATRVTLSEDPRASHQTYAVRRTPADRSAGAERVRSSPTGSAPGR
jgi:hypothetical protein